MATDYLTPMEGTEDVWGWQGLKKKKNPAAAQIPPAAAPPEPTSRKAQPEPAGLRIAQQTTGPRSMAGWNKAPQVPAGYEEISMEEASQVGAGQGVKFIGGKAYRPSAEKGMVQDMSQPQFATGPEIKAPSRVVDTTSPGLLSANAQRYYQSRLMPKAAEPPGLRAMDRPLVKKDFAPVPQAPAPVTQQPAQVTPYEKTTEQNVADAIAATRAERMSRGLKSAVPQAPAAPAPAPVAPTVVPTPVAPVTAPPPPVATQAAPVATPPSLVRPSAIEGGNTLEGTKIRERFGAPITREALKAEVKTRSSDMRNTLKDIDSAIKDLGPVDRNTHPEVLRQLNRLYDQRKQAQRFLNRWG